MRYTILEGEEVCSNCKHYYQHYVKTEDREFYACNCGHCIYPRTKTRKPNQHCDNFEMKKR